MKTDIKKELDKYLKRTNGYLYPGTYTAVAKKFGVSRSYVQILAKSWGYKIDTPLAKCDKCGGYYLTDVDR